MKPSYSSTRNLLKWPKQPTCADLDQWLLTVSDEVAQVQRKYERDIQLRHAVLEDLRTRLDQLGHFNHSQKGETSNSMFENRDRKLLIFKLPITDAKTEKEQVLKILELLKVHPSKYLSHTRLIVENKMSTEASSSPATSSDTTSRFNDTTASQYSTSTRTPPVIVELDSKDTRNAALNKSKALYAIPELPNIHVTDFKTLKEHIRLKELMKICNSRNSELEHVMIGNNRLELKYGLDNDGKRYYWNIRPNGLEKKYIDEMKDTNFVYKSK